jgi:hypothetical protein
MPEVDYGAWDVRSGLLTFETDAEDLAGADFLEGEAGMDESHGA